jgi:hypothetical protein
MMTGCNPCVLGVFPTLVFKSQVVTVSPGIVGFTCSEQEDFYTELLHKPGAPKLTRVV